MSGILSSDISLRTEWTLGSNSFPAIVQAALPVDIGTVIEGVLVDRKRWNCR